ncbi:hypothetical protein [Thiomicrorhabdus aquaedulcis]|uniref:hypothetical protein n=1 Tax=Thiomicrorhabdus aquaedulcis TaxID=2211106 RepID=UPI000FD975FD|nr:hypothetical protein [Thiomicrorhabdus aquaedulcis]
MSEPIIPHAQHRVIDPVLEGEFETNTATDKADKADKVAADKLFEEQMQRAKAYSASKAPDSSGAKVTVKGSVFKKYQRPLIWTGVLGAGLLTLVWTRPDTDWLVDNINTLQTQVMQLQTDSQGISTQQQTLLAQLDERINSHITTQINDTVKPELQATISSAINAELATALTRPGQEGVEGVKSVENVQSVNSAELDAFKTSITQQVQQMEQHFAQQLEQRLTQQRQQNNPTQAINVQPLSALQVEDWISQINLQWQLTGAAAQTRVQLLALETTLERSALAQKTALARLIGQDLVYLQMQANQTSHLANQPNSAIQGLKTAMANLPLQPKITNDSSAKPEPQSQTLANGTLSAGETLDSASATQQLLGKLNELMSLKKRDDSQSLTQVEAILMHDVILQRLALLIERLEWALQTQSQSALNAGLVDLKRLVEQYLNSHVVAFEPWLATLSQVRFEERAPLSITQALASSTTSPSAQSSTQPIAQ